MEWSETHNISVRGKTTKFVVEFGQVGGQTVQLNQPKSKPDFGATLDCDNCGKELFAIGELIPVRCPKCKHLSCWID